MTVYSADFGPDAATATAGLTEYSAAGAVIVARITSGIAHIGNGVFAKDFTPNASTGILVWDADGLYASEPVYPASGGGGGLDAAGVRAAIGLASANLDSQLSAVAGYVDTEVAAIKAKTDNLPANPAAASDIPSAAAVAAETLSAAQTTPIYSRVVVINNTPLAGAGTAEDPVRPA